MREPLADKNSAIKQALQRRQTTTLPSNFSYKLMQQVYHEEQRKLRRNKRLVNCGLGLTSMILIALASISIWWYTDFNLDGLGTFFTSIFQDSASWFFYSYISVIVILLLGLDFLLRRWYMSKKGY